MGEQIGNAKLQIYFGDVASSEQQAIKTNELIQQGLAENGVEETNAFSESPEEFLDKIGRAQIAALTAHKNEEIVGVLTAEMTHGEEFGIDGNEQNPVQEITISVDDSNRNDTIAKRLFVGFKQAGINALTREDMGGDKESVTAVIQMPATNVPEWKIEKLTAEGFENAGEKPGNPDIHIWAKKYPHVAAAPTYYGFINSAGVYSRN